MVVVDASVLVDALLIDGATLLTADARATQAPGLFCSVELLAP